MTKKHGEKTVEFYGEPLIADIEFKGNRADGSIKVKGFEPRISETGQSMQLVQVINPSFTPGKTDISWLALIKNRDGSTDRRFLTDEQAAAIHRGEDFVQLRGGITTFTEGQVTSRAGRAPVDVSPGPDVVNFPPLPEEERN